MRVPGSKWCTLGLHLFLSVVEDPSDCSWLCLEVVCFIICFFGFRLVFLLLLLLMERLSEKFYSS